MKNDLTPILLFVYNRPWHTKRTIKALQKNSLARESLLYVFSDGPKNDKDVDRVKEVREYIKIIKGFKKVEIFKSEKNKGLASSVIFGVTKIINKYDRVIVLEDDLVVSSIFLVYMNKMLEEYKVEKRVYSITGYNHPPKIMKIPKNYPYDIYFNSRASSWSWATWRDRWKNVDWEVKNFKKFLEIKELQKKFNQSGDDMTQMLINQMQDKIDSWAIRWCYHHFKHSAFCVHPVKSYVNNIGLDGTGVHCGNASNRFKNEGLNKSKEVHTPKKIEINNEIMNNFRKIYKTKLFKSIVARVLKNLSCLIFIKK